MPDKSQPKSYASSRYLTSSRASSARSSRGNSAQTSGNHVSNGNGNGSGNINSNSNKTTKIKVDPVNDDTKKWAQVLEHKELPKGIKSEAALQNKQRNDGVIGEYLKTVQGMTDYNPMPPPRCTSKAALQIRAKHMESEVAKAMDNRQNYELPVQKPRCQGNEAHRNRRSQLDSKINFEEMFSSDEYPILAKTKLGPSSDCARNFQKSVQSELMSTILSHDYDRELTPPPPRRVSYGGVRIATKSQGDYMSAVMHGQHEENDKPPPKLGSSTLARSIYEQHQGSGDTWIRGEHEGDELPAPRVRYGGQRVAEFSSGGAMRQTLHEQNEPEPQPLLRVTSQAARRNYDCGSGNTLKTAVFADYTQAPIDEQPVPKTRSALAEEVRNHGMNGTAQYLLKKYGTLMGDDKPNPPIRFGARGIYKKSQGGAMSQALHGPPKRKSRPRSSNM